MKKVLIVSYFFPPCNLTASQRAFSWAKYLGKFGYRPIILTRRWDHKANSVEDLFRSTPDKVLHESNEFYDTYYLPYRSNLRDRFLVRYGEKRFVAIRKFLSFMELLLQNLWSVSYIHESMVRFADTLLQEDPDIKRVITSGNPFVTFKIGYLLRKKYGVKWVTDYRDAWTTSEINFINSTVPLKVIRWIDHHFEKKWVSEASFITASSLPIANGITRLTGVESSALFNGFVCEDFDDLPADKFGRFTITYVGTLYPTQKIEIFCTAYKRLVDFYPDIQIKLFFPGLLFYPGQADKVIQIMNGYEDFYECTQRMDRTKILEIEKKSHLLLHVAWDEHEGIIASKMYEYLASGTFILVTPSDKGSIQEILDKSGCGVYTNTTDDTFNFLKQEYDSYLKGTVRSNDTTRESVKQFSRENQVKHLAEMLDKI